MQRSESPRDAGQGRNRGRAAGEQLPREAEPQGRAVVSPGQALTIFQRSLTTMQLQVAGLLQFAVPLFPTAEVRRLPPTASVLEEGAPQLDPDIPPPARTSPLLNPGASQSRAVERAPWPLCTRCCLWF